MLGLVGPARGQYMGPAPPTPRAFVGAFRREKVAVRPRPSNPLMLNVLRIPRGHGSINVQRGWADSSGAVVTKDLPIPLSDGTLLMANVYRPPTGARLPVLLHCVPYGKDGVPKPRLCGLLLTPPPQYMIMKLAFQGDIGDLAFSDETPWEAADPARWVPHGYAVVQVDSRGFGHSQGEASPLMSAKEAEDFAEVIQWCGEQSWSTGSVGLIGVSYLAISQWHVAARGQSPPALKAICPWEGMFDPYAHCAFIGGVGPSTFFAGWSFLTGNLGRGRGAKELSELSQKTSDANNARLPAWEDLVPPIENISVPALVCASFSDQGVHTPGTFEAFERLQARKHGPGAWLFAHGRAKWSEFYGDAGLAQQRKFFDYFLKGDENGWLDTPRVQLDVKESATLHHRLVCDRWPPAEEQAPLVVFQLGSAGSLEPAANGLETAWRLRREDTEGHSEAAAQGGPTLDEPLASPKGLIFRHRFTEDTTVLGYSAARLYLHLEGGATDADVFVYLRKLDTQGNQVEQGYGWDEVDHAAEERSILLAGALRRRDGKCERGRSQRSASPESHLDLRRRQLHPHPPRAHPLRPCPNGRRGCVARASEAHADGNAIPPGGSS